MQKGLQWLPELNKNLSTTGFGLLVLTADNKNAPWLVFEAGVISKALPDKHCCPLLCDLKQTDVSGPLAQFQSTVVTAKDDMLKLARTMNEASGTSNVDDQRLTKWFNMAWDDFAKKTGDVLATKTTAPSAAAKAGPTDRELLEEVLQTTRRLAIEPSMRMDEMRLRERERDDRLLMLVEQMRIQMETGGFRGFEGRLVVPPNVLLDGFAQLPKSVQTEIYELLDRTHGDKGLRQMKTLLDLARHGSAIRRNKPPEESNDSSK